VVGVGLGADVLVADGVAVAGSSFFGGGLGAAVLMLAIDGVAVEASRFAFFGVDVGGIALALAFVGGAIAPAQSAGQRLGLACSAASHTPSPQGFCFGLGVDI